METGFFWRFSLSVADFRRNAPATQALRNFTSALEGRGYSQLIHGMQFNSVVTKLILEAA